MPTQGPLGSDQVLETAVCPAPAIRTGPVPETDAVGRERQPTSGLEEPTELSENVTRAGHELQNPSREHAVEAGVGSRD